jgi:hypothetical protein
MIFQCNDLERALRSPELMPEARAHAATCAQCREELDMWEQISLAAAELHEEWDSPSLWPRIRAELSAGAAPRSQSIWQWALAAAAILVVTAALFQLQSNWMPGPQQDDHFLEADALREVERAEAAYLRSIEKLSAVAGATLQESPSPLAAVYREKLLLLDSAIADVKASVESNQYNVYLQTQLASLYRDKQATLEEWLENAKKN